MDAGAYNYAIAFQERIKISDEKMEFYKVNAVTLRLMVLCPSNKPGLNVEMQTQDSWFCWTTASSFISVPDSEGLAQAWPLLSSVFRRSYICVICCY